MGRDEFIMLIFAGSWGDIARTLQAYKAPRPQESTLYISETVQIRYDHSETLQRRNVLPVLRCGASWQCRSTNQSGKGQDFIDVISWPKHPTSQVLSWASLLVVKDSSPCETWNALIEREMSLHIVSWWSCPAFLSGFCFIPIFPNNCGLSSLVLSVWRRF